MSRKDIVKIFLAPISIGVLSPLVVAFVIWIFGMHNNFLLNETRSYFIQKEIDDRLERQEICIIENENEIKKLKKMIDSRFDEENVRYDGLKDYIQGENTKIRREIYNGNKELQRLIISLLKNGKTSEFKTESTGKDFREGQGGNTTAKLENTQGMENYGPNMFYLGGSGYFSLWDDPTRMDYMDHRGRLSLQFCPWNMGWIPDR